MILTRRLKKEYRATARNPSGDLLEALVGDRKTTSGERVNESTVFGIAAYYGAIRCISEDCAKVPCPLFKRLKPRGKDRKPAHRVHELLNGSANPEMASLTWRETSFEYALGWGNGISEIKRDGTGNPTTMWPLHPTRVTLMRNSAGELFGRVTEADGSFRAIPYRNLFHLRGVGDGVLGYCIARLAKESLGGALAKMKAGNALFGKGSRPATVIKFPEGHTLGTDAHQALREEWERMHGGGAENQARTAILEDGADLKVISVANKDAQWIEAKLFDVEEIVRLFRMPPHKLQHLLRATFSNISEQNIEYVWDTLWSWMRRFEVEVQRKLLNGRSDLFVEHDVDDLLKGAPKERSEAFQIKRRNGVMSANEWREKDNENPIEGDEGDWYIVEGNMTRLDHVGETPDDVIGDGAEPTAVPDSVPDDEPPVSRGAIKLLVAEETRRLMRDAEVSGGEDPGRKAKLIDQAAEACRPVLLDAFRRILRCECDKIARAAKKPKFDEWKERFYAGHAEHVLEVLAPIVQAFEASAWLLVGEGDLPQRIAERFGQFSKVVATDFVERSQYYLRTWPDRDGMLAAWPTTDGRAGIETEQKAKSLAAIMKEVCGLIEETSDADSNA